MRGNRIVNTSLYAKLLLISALFAGGGYFMLRYTDAPKWIGWLNLLFFGIGGGLFIIIRMLQKSKVRERVGQDTREVCLKDGKDYEVRASDHEILLFNKAAQKTASVNWSDLTEVYAVAIDAFPVGSISWILHKGGEVLEIPWDASNGHELLKKMQSKLPGFDNEAVIEISSVLHGFKRVWARDQTISAP